ncbi:hypothetical protein [Leptospira interrogans]|uniref:hypothetical protein n=1 Tax=Leptospira interrogans TaxID=173 RepID=UPI0003495245|nr:hypothetical protein [Leptospira interrogans]ULG94516.1 hypothetical protein FH584_19755 [Leptospira interrogans]ULG94545.1 hypothetical protein FH584_19460 [Leptospira interrogans]UMQ56424.1 hypothetical protein FH582_22110 [Leptospira interrogans]
MIGLSGLGAGAAAIFVGETILSPYTMQAYAAGGNSKSSFNNIHWDEKSARKWACYATAGQLAAMAYYGYTVVDAALIASGSMEGANIFASSWVRLNAPLFGPFSALDAATLPLLMNDIGSGNWKGVAEGVTTYSIKAGLGKSVPVGIIVNSAELVGKTCEGPL